MPGHGNTPGYPPPGPPEGKSGSQYMTRKGGPVDIVYDAMNYVGAKKITFIGYDWGGGIALAFALKYPARVKKIVGHCICYREVDDLVKIKCPVQVLWEKDDLNHSYKNGQAMAAKMKTKVINIDGSSSVVLKEAMAFITAKPTAKATTKKRE